MEKFVTLPSGVKMPKLGLGTVYFADEATGLAAVEAALDVGYRHLDTAWQYSSEQWVGQAVRNKVAAGVLDSRADVFITTKLWNAFHKAEKVRPACLESLERLGMDYVDLFLIHWPVSITEESNVMDPEYTDDDYVDTWREMEKLKEEGLVKEIGVSNFSQKQLARVLANCQVRPANLQIEVTPYCQNQELIVYATTNGISVTGYSPFGSPYPDMPLAKPGDPRPLEDDVIKEIATRCSMTAGQVILSWALQRGICILAKSTKKERLQENMQALEMTLSDEDMAKINSISTKFRTWSVGIWRKSPKFPFKDEIE